MAIFDSNYDIKTVNGTQLDLWINPGIYLFTAEAMQASHNAPTTETGSLIVFSTNNKNYVYQFFLEYANNTIYFRSKLGNTWTSWASSSSNGTSYVTVVSSDSDNLISAGSDGGAYLSLDEIGIGSVLQNAVLEEGILKLTWKLTDSSTVTTNIDLSALIDEYTSGIGIKIENNVVNLDVEYLDSLLSELGYVTKTELEEVSDSIPDVSNFVTNTELATEIEIVKALIPVVDDFVTSSELSSAIRTVEGKIPDISSLFAKLDYNSSTGVLTFYNSDSVEVATVTIPNGGSGVKDAYLEYNENSSYTEVILVIEIGTTDGPSEYIKVNLADLSDHYGADNGVMLVEGAASSGVFVIDQDWLDEYLVAELPDLINYATKAELTALEESLADEYCIAYVTSDTGTSRIQNEVTGSGPMYIHTDGTKSYVGVNNGGADGIVGQLYAIDSSTAYGTRLNIFKKGMYYIANKSNTDADYVIDDATREIAVKGDIPSLEGYALTAEVTTLISSAITEVEGKMPSTTNLVASAVYNLSTGTLSLRNSNDVELGTVTIPSTGTVLQAAELQEDGKLKMTWVLADSSTTETTVDLSDLIDVYKAGTGLTETDNTFSIDTEYLTGVINTALTDINATLASLSTTVADNTTNISTLQSLVSTNTENISNLQTTVEGHTTNITSLQESISTINNNISELEDKISEITYDIPLYFDDNSITNGIHTFLPENAATIQLIKIEADGSGTTDLGITMSGDISLSDSMTVTTTDTDCTTFAGYAVVFTLTGVSDQTKIAVLARCTLS